MSASFSIHKDKTTLTERGVMRYVELLKIPEDELNDPHSLILDLGSGTEQNFAKDIRKFNLKSKIISLDPRLGLSEGEDVDDLFTKSHKEARIQGRKNPETKTAGGLSSNLPFLDSIFDRIYALYSVPYYLNYRNPSEVSETLQEMLRILKPGGVIRAFPIESEQLDIVKNFLKSMDSVSFVLEETETSDGEDYGSLLVITKK